MTRIKLVLFFLALFLLSVNYVLADWFPPLNAPTTCEDDPSQPGYQPGCNLPINVSSLPQGKDGPLAIFGLLQAANRLFVSSQTSDQMDTDSYTKLEVDGNFRLPATTLSGTKGIIKLGNFPYLHNYFDPSAPLAAYYENLYLGKNAGNFNNTGTGNVGIGFDALRNVSNGAFNVALGAEAMKSRGGAGNVAIGTNALSYGTSNNSVGIGSPAMSHTSGDHNTALGSDAGLASGPGFVCCAWSTTRSTFLGSGAGVVLDPGENLVNVTAIGANARVGSSYSMVLGGSGVDAINVGIGTPEPQATLHVVSDNGRGLVVNDSSNVSGVKGLEVSIDRSEADSDVLNLLSSGTSRFSVKGNGDVCIGTDCRASWSGGPSSIRWKTDIKPIVGALDKVEQLEGVSFRWEDTYGGKNDYGFIAEEVGKVIPELVSWEADGRNAKSVNYEHLTAILLEAIKEQQKEIKELRALIDN